MDRLPTDEVLELVIGVRHGVALTRTESETLLMEVLNTRADIGREDSRYNKQQYNLGKRIEKLQHTVTAQWRRIQDLSDENTVYRLQLGIPCGAAGRRELHTGICAECGIEPVGEVGNAARIPVCDGCAYTAMRIQLEYHHPSCQPQSVKGRKSKRTVRLRVFERDGFLCRYCGDVGTKQTLTVDHLVPERSGGAYTITNLVTACNGCNGRKAGRSPVEAGMKLLPVKPK